MPVIEPVPADEITDKTLKKYLEQAEDLRVPDPLFVQIMAHSPSHANAVLDAMFESLAKGNVDPCLKEIIRIRLARQAKDPYFSGLRLKIAEDAGLTEERIDAGCGDFETSDAFTDAEKWALRYAHLMFTEPKKVNQAFYDEGKQYWSEAEIMELGTLIAYHYGFDVWMRTLKALPLTAA